MFHDTSKKPMKSIFFSSSVKAVLLLIMLLLSSSCGLCQSPPDYIAQQICQQLQTVPLDQADSQIAQQSIKIIQTVYQDNQSILYPLIGECIESKPSNTQAECATVIGKNIVFRLIQTCEVFMRITMFNNKPLAPVSPLTQRVGSYFSQLLRQRSQEQPIDQKMIFDCMDDATAKYEKQLIQQFGTIHSEEFAIEFNVYISTKSKPYMRYLADNIPMRF